MPRTAFVTLSALLLTLLAACAARAPAVPPVVNGWREYPLRQGVVAIAPGKWRTDTVDVTVPAGKGLEYKLTMKKGETLVYNISYGTLTDPGRMISEFHGHTPQVGGVGDLMFYAKTGGTPQSDSATDVVVKLELAGFYQLEKER
jgi:hypothetical protein